MNIKVLNTLPHDRSINAQYAAIARLDGKATWEFLLLPTEMQWSRGISYQPSNTSGNVPILQFASINGWSLSMSFPAGANDALIGDYIDQLTSLMQPENGAPPILFWRWGQRQLSPCVMLKCDRTESRWTKDGQLLECRIDLVLGQVNEKQLVFS
ncbi:MAG: hypothetical protein KME60_03305 [Cyanomargarita calcarea GSE-NOS-MK-12-04C]|jgi:hypothetical protein|uniref:Uncharacterized protein n=1 Tax=Cyanomargarita calcarea GSE-NOS-MK-12-04C TaxID=2839659 RepID=A0A951QIV9_9CYAN|nr:hypothetical protein [Cyanomargarita calcarea GSE-NOS-MK-12-04C]